MAAQWISALASFAVAAAVSASLFFLFRSQRNPIQIVQYRIVILLLFFAISTVSSLLFAGNASFSGKLGAAFTVSVVGPATLWIVALVIFTYFYPETRLGPLTGPGSIATLTQLVAETERLSGWQPYKDWKGRWNEFSTILGSGESATVKNLLWYTYFQTPGRKLARAEVTTAFFYFRSYTLKLQRIRGSRVGEAFNLRFSAATSLTGSNAMSLLFVGREHHPMAILSAYGDHGQGALREIELTQERVDCLIVSAYTGDNPDEGDYVVVDLKQFSDDARGYVRLGIIDFEKSIHHIHLSTLKRRTVVDDDVPLCFRAEPQSHSDALDTLENNFGGWPLALDELILNVRGPLGSHSTALQEVRDTLRANFTKAGLQIGDAQRLFSSLFSLSRQSAKSRTCFDLKDAQEIILTMFLY